MNFDFSLSIPIYFLGYKFAISIGQVFLFTINIALMVFAGRIVTAFSFNEKDTAGRVWGFRFFNLSFVILQILDIILIGLKSGYQQSLAKFSFSLITCYIGYLTFHISSHFVDRKFGKVKNIDGKEVGIVSYSSRMVNLLLVGTLFFFVLVTIINIWEYNSLLEATGLIGLFLGFLALSSSIWGPDLFHGLVLLNSNTVEAGDIIELNEEYFIVHKTSFMETVLLDISNNRRTRLRNSTLADMKIDNITKIAHSHGLRETITYKIGYPIDYHKSKQDRQKELQEHNEKVKDMLDAAFEEVKKDENIPINSNLQFETFLTNTGDFALEYSVSFYLGKIKKTHFTHQARTVIRTKFLVNEKIFEQAVVHGIDLSTPIVHNQV